MSIFFLVLTNKLLKLFAFIGYRLSIIALILSPVFINSLRVD